MELQNEPHLNRPNADDPIATVRDLLNIVDHLHKQVSSKMEYQPSRVARSTNKEANESNNPNDAFRRIPLSLPPRGINSDGDLFLRLSRHLELFERRLYNLHHLQNDVQDELLRHYRPLQKLRAKLKKVSSDVSYRFSSRLTKGMMRDLEDISRKISDSVEKLSVLPDKATKQKTLHSQEDDGDNHGKIIIYLPGLQKIPEDLTKLEAFRQVEQIFTELEVERKICLLSFAVFPENREVHRTMLMYWWIGEGILPAEGAEEAVRKVLKEFTDKNLVESVKERRKVAPSSYKMNPFVHSSVIHLSRKIGLFDIYGKEGILLWLSELGKVCLVEGSSFQENARAKKLPPDEIETVFNVSETYPEFAFKWFFHATPKRKLIKLTKTVFKSLHVFYLGRWERTQKRYIQVRNPELMKRLKGMTNLRVLSFQGISSIRRLKSSVCKLHKLIVLDLRECSDLAKLPENIDSLRSLVYLDMTGCYMLEWIPMKLALLKNLEVLKGFVICDTMYEVGACTLSLLKRLKKLRKLSIEIQRDDLGLHQLMVDLVKLNALTSLKVTWRRGLNIIRVVKRVNSTKIESLPHQLKKLDLQRFPHEELPTWLQPHNLLHLKRLHIGGGTLLKGFGDLPEKATQCAVEILRLTSLPRLRIGWIELKQIHFPNLRFLEKYECPRVSLTPCDGNGIWRCDQD